MNPEVPGALERIVTKALQKDREVRYQAGLEWIARGVEEHDLLLASSLRTEPGYDALRSHSAYHALLRKMNLEP